MERLTNEQLANLKKTTEMGIATRQLLAKELVNALGDGWRCASGFVNGHQNSIILITDNQRVGIGTYRLANQVAIKVIFLGEYTYWFKKDGSIDRITKVRLEKIDGLTHAIYEEIQ